VSRLNRRTFLAWAAAAAGAAAMPGGLSASAPDGAAGDRKPSGGRKPNVLFIAVDDLRPELGCYGVREILSPNIDRLAKRGILFDRAYCQQAVCNPSRASLLTGLRPDTLKVWDLVTKFRDLTPDAVTLPQYFKQNGYYAVGMGKIFHNPFPDPPSWTIPDQPSPKGCRLYSKEAQRVLDQRYAEACRKGMSMEEARNRIRGPATECEDVPDNRRFDGALGDLAVEYLQKAKAQPLPFFLAVGFILPHLPWTPPKKYWYLYDPMKIPMATNDFLPHGAPPMAMGGFYELQNQSDFKGAPNPEDGTLTEAQRRRLKHGYYASVSFTDAQVGRLLDELDRLGLSDNTIVVLWGDHGWKLGEHNGWCKQTNYEVDTRSPLLFVVPGAKTAGKTTAALAEFVDIYPTLCDLAGLPLPPNLAGRSLTPVLGDPSASVKAAAFSQFPRRWEGASYMGYAMRTDRYRYVEWLNRRTAEVAAVELYDEKADPEENTNIAVQPDQQALVRQLSDQLWKALPRPAPDPKADEKKKAPPPPKAEAMQPFGEDLAETCPADDRMPPGLVAPRGGSA
jgi:arylsulfatase A-like enzyme